MHGHLVLVKILLPLRLDEILANCKIILQISTFTVMMSVFNVCFAFIFLDQLIIKIVVSSIVNRFCHARKSLFGTNLQLGRHKASIFGYVKGA